MSDETLQEPDILPERRMGIIAAVSLALLLVAVVVAAILLEADLESLDLEESSHRHIDVVAPPEIGGVKQTNIWTSRYGLRLRAAQESVLSGYGWVDRERGLVRIPIEEAMRLVAEGKR